MRTTLVVFLALAVGCGGGGSGTQNSAANNPGGSNNPPLTAQELLEGCLAGDLQDLSAVIGLLQGMFEGGDAPQPEFNLIAGLLTGTFPWTLDVDEDGTADLTGTLNLSDASGKVLGPAELAALVTLLGGGTPASLGDFLAALPDGTSVNLTFAFDGLSLLQGSAAGATGDGALSVEIRGGAPVSASGSGSVESGDCTFDFTFDDVDVTALLGGGTFGTASVDFELASAGHTLTGSVALDGTDLAQVTASLDGGTPETYTLDLTTGQLVP